MRTRTRREHRRARVARSIGRWAAAALTIVGLAAICWPASATRTFAVIVANNGSQDPDVRPLRFADDDGARYWEIFSAFADETRLLATLDAETQKVHPSLADQSVPPTLANVRRVLGEVQERVRAVRAGGERAELYVVFVGHGAVDDAGVGYLSLRDGRYTRPMLLRDVVEPDVANRTHLIIDACHAYFMVLDRGDGDARTGRTYDDELEAFLNKREILDRYPNLGLLLSTAGAAEVHEWARYGGGVFSHQVRSGLMGAADVDGDLRVTYPEMASYLAAANDAIKDPRTRIRVEVIAPRQNLQAAVIDLEELRSTTLLTVGASLAGRYYIEDNRGLRYADLHSEEGTDVHVALLAQSPYYFVRTEASEARVGSVAGGRVELSDQQFVARSDNPRGPQDEAYRRDLYATPFGPGFHRGFHARDGDAALRGSVRTGWVDHVGLRLGYGLSAPQLSAFQLDGLQHNFDAVVSLWLGTRVAVDLVAEYGHSAHDQVRGVDRAPFRLHRPALGVGVRYEAQMAGVVVGVDGRLLNQWLVLDSDDDGDAVEPLSFRAEAAASLGWAVTPRLRVVARGGLSASVYSIALADEPGSRTHTDYLPQLSLQAAWAF